jgi:SAM-dependent methyltransferase
MTPSQFQQNAMLFEMMSRKVEQRFLLDFSQAWPCLNEDSPSSGWDRHYTLHPVWAASVLREINPKRHVDIGSYLPWVTMMSAFFPMEFYDFRPADIQLPDLKCGQADLKALPFDDGSIECLSCMHVAEHIGLGRYGDMLDPDGDTKAMAELERVLAPGGNLLFVVPLGTRPQILFNAHRLYTAEQIEAAFAGLILEEFAFIADDLAHGDLVRHCTPSEANGLSGCGCFWFRKPEKGK